MCGVVMVVVGAADVGAAVALFLRAISFVVLCFATRVVRQWVPLARPGTRSRM